MPTPYTWAANRPSLHRQQLPEPYAQGSLGQELFQPESSAERGDARGRVTLSVLSWLSNWVNCQFLLCGFSSKTKIGVVLLFP